MANYVPFEQLKVGESYYFYSTYWHETLGIAKIDKLYPESGTGTAYSSWGEDKSSTFCFGVDDGFHNDMLWDSEPTQEEVQHQMHYGVKYVPPRIIEGKRYEGGSVITGDLKKVLDEFIMKLNQTFEKNTRFKPDKYNAGHFFMWESKLEYVKPSELFINHNGGCDWDMIRYVMKNANVNIHAGERDSCGWLTGVIDKKMPDGTMRSILYG